MLKKIWYENPAVLLKVGTWYHLPKYIRKFK